jgi:Fur family transcriptional regulator, peroxide stress response regulator
LIIWHENKMKDWPERLTEFEDRCRQGGLKVTPQRIAVYQALVESREHPSADTVFQKVRQSQPSISLDTVNRTLLTLAEMGAAFVVEGSGEAKRFDANLQSHQHFKCIRCKRIVDFHHPPFDDVPVPAGLNKGFKVLRKTVYFEGICDQCTQDRKRQQPKETPHEH